MVGKGFTEWTNRGKARPLLSGHYQSHVPADLGYYDPRVPEIRKEQADIAPHFGIESFCYRHLPSGTATSATPPWQTRFAIGCSSTPTESC